DEPEATTEKPEEEIEIVVTGEQEEEGYRVRNAITGTRTDTPLRDIPQSIQAVPQQVLEDQRVNRLNEALRNVSGVTQGTESSRSVFDFFLIRGFSTRSIYRNGLRDDTNVTGGSGVANIERVEVLKGPASVLYGRGGPGGTINIVTKQPQSEPSYLLEGTVGNYDTYGGSLDFTGPLNDSKNLLYRLTASARHADNFIDFGESERYFISPALTWLIGDNTNLTFEAEYLDIQQPQDQGLPARGTVLPNPNGELPIERQLGEPEFGPRNRHTFRVGYNFEHRFNEDWLVRNAFRASFQRIDEFLVFSRSLRPDNRTLERRITDVDIFIKDVYSLNTNIVGNFNTGGIRHTLLAGVDLSREYNRGTTTFKSIAPIDIFNPVYGAPVGEVITTFNDQDVTDGLGIYLQDQIALADNLKVVLGGRFDIVEQRFTDFLDSSSNSSQQSEAFSPRVGIVYQPIEPVSLYASYSRSFNPVTGTAFGGSLFQPERGTQYEVGVKAELLGGRLSSTLAFYNLTRTNVTTQDLVNPGFNVQTGEQRSRGVELDVVGEILPGWNVIASYAYTDANITKDNRFEVGNRLNNVPEHAASLWTTYELQNGALQGLGLGVGIFYVGEREGDLGNTFSLPSYLRTDAALYYRRNNLRASLNVKNLFDINYFETASSNVNVYPGSPRGVEFTVGWEF
ncbi:MAG: TonB-dependent siderophore receptor, partial [Coleofasciculus sp. C3-bin4]|nr:TonB-dependent siderophore receptor [Coleofasciculus sp. C3-bin4]